MVDGIWVERKRPYPVFDEDALDELFEEFITPSISGPALATSSLLQEGFFDDCEIDAPSVPEFQEFCADLAGTILDKSTPPRKVQKLRHMPLLHQKKQIRLLQFKKTTTDTIQCRIENFYHHNCSSGRDCPLRKDPHNRPEYKALSYTWGTAYPSRNIFVGDRLIDIGENLWQFLDRVKDDTVSWYWIDALCIDQSNISERNDQVEIMGAIYNQACEVIAWLGPSDQYSDFLIDNALNTLSSSYPTYRKILSQPDVETALLAFCHRPYWTRVWILQEILLARTLTIHCGPKVFEWERFHQLIRTCEIIHARPGDFVLESVDHINHSPIPNVIIQICRYRLRTKTRGAAASHFDWQAVFDGHFLENKCADIRDKIFGMQGFLREEQRVQIDYSKSIGQIFVYVMRTVSMYEPDWTLATLVKYANMLKDTLLMQDVQQEKIQEFVEELFQRRKDKIQEQLRPLDFWYEI